MSSEIIAPPSQVTVIGLGQMGLPMAKRLIGAGFIVHGVDPMESPRAALVAAEGMAFADSCRGVAGSSAIITILPNGGVVRDVLIGDRGIAHSLPKDTLIIDMSSSAPSDTTSLSAKLGALGLPLVDAPVSGGVKRATDGSLSIMAGGPAQEVERARPIFAAIGKSIFPTGPIGSGHAMKALNNYVSAAGLLAACEALIVGSRFGLAPETIVDVLNASTGKNNSTEEKLKPFVIPATYNSGFSLALMAKDLRIAADLSDHLGLGIPQISSVAELWEQARQMLAADADHTEIHRYLVGLDPR